MYILFAVFGMFAFFSGAIAKDMLDKTGDAEFGRSGCLGTVFSLLSGLSIAAGVVAAFLILGWWKAFGSMFVGVLLGMFVVHVMPKNPFTARRISDTACVVICAYIYALYWGLLDPGPFKDYFPN